MPSADPPTGVDALLELVAPPPEVEPRSSEEWAGIEADIGPLPPDYTAFIDRVGFVRLDDFLMIYSPFAPAGHGNLIDQRAIDLDAYRAIREGRENEMPLAPWPEPGGLLPFGRTDNGDVLFWRTGGDTWPIVVIGEGDRRHSIYETTLVELLSGLVSGDITVDVFPGSFPREPSRFVPVL